VSSKTPNGIRLATEAATPLWIEFRKNQKKDEKQRKKFLPFSASVTPSYSWEDYGVNLGVSLTHENLKVSGQKETLFGVDGTSLELNAETDLTPSWEGSKLEGQFDFANDKVAVRLKGEYDYPEGVQNGELSVAGQYKSFHFGARPAWQAPEEDTKEDKKLSLELAVLYHQPLYQVQVGGKFSQAKAGIGLDWFQRVSDSVAYTLHFCTKRNNESGDYCGTNGAVGGKWTWDANTELQGRVRVSSKDKKTEMRGDLAISQSITSYCKATLYADVNLLQVTSGKTAPGKPHSFAVELTLE